MEKTPDYSDDKTRDPRNPAIAPRRKTPPNETPTSEA